MNIRQMEPHTLQPDDLAHLVKLAAGSNAAGANASLRRLARKYRSTYPELHSAIVHSLRDRSVRGPRHESPIDQPLDEDTKFSLLRLEGHVTVPHEPILPTPLRSNLDNLVEEHIRQELLLEAGLSPTRTALFVGQPGVGKTLSARWVAMSLDMPLATLDLSSVMNSFLGRSGTNIRRVFEYARSAPLVLFLDELDSIAKHRDDATEVGELKRLVTILLQEIDNWPEGSLLLAATNHSKLLDPAIWRRFELVLDFPLPILESRTKCVLQEFDDPEMNPKLARAIAALYDGQTLSQIQNDIMRAQRRAVLTGQNPIEAFLWGIRDRFAAVPTNKRGPIAAKLMADSTLSQRAIHDITGVSRDTLRKYSQLQQD
ncbi:ATP-binding protein [Corynebacterium coyleae]|uniref:AAA family ATPase n=1 Tax=Corynebacterium TaxID=1716 RepID=UPI0009F1F27F|nr:MULTISPECIES: ATP-binding protein [Corynebacterium]MDK6492784.1 ATP-binding protein [Corynebacterium coyleae]